MEETLEEMTDPKMMLTWRMKLTVKEEKDDEAEVATEEEIEAEIEDEKEVEETEIEEDDIKF